MSFAEYLKHKKCSGATIKTYLKYLDYFTAWLIKENLDAATLTYTELLDYIRWLQDSGKNKGTVSNQLCVVRHYMNHLIAEQRRNDNPAAGVFIRGIIRKLPSGLLSNEELKLLYQQYVVQLHVQDYKKILLGLLIFQGLTLGELARLRTRDIRLQEGKIFIRGTARSNERLLPLHVHQMLWLKKYLDTGGFKDDVSTSLGNRIQYMFGQLRRLNKKVINAKQIRSSVITEWLKQHHLRQVQYMAGHKYVSSTERYQLNHLDDLKTALQEHHPMK
jgi:integrase/recombinase XerD